MQKSAKLILPCLFVAAIMCFGAMASAQETPAPQVTAGDLGIQEPSILPDSPFYFLKELSRQIRITFTFNSTAKAELESQFASEKLLELQKLSQKQGVSQPVMERALERYQNAIQLVKERADKIKQNAEEDANVGSFLEKFTNRQMLQERILERIQAQVPEDVAQKIIQTREANMERFGEVMQKLEENKEMIAERIQNALQNQGEQAGQLLERIQNKMPEDIRQKISERMNQGQVACTMEYAPVCGANGKTYGNRCMAGAAGAKIAHEGECPGNQQGKICQTDSDCPVINCIKAPCPQQKCVQGKCQMREPGECSTDSDCETGKKCFDEQCINPEAITQKGCQNMWWYDNTSRACQQKQFCGAYMYMGLKTFETESACKQSLSSETSSSPGKGQGNNSSN